MSDKPKLFLILKIVGFVGIIVAIFGIVMIITGFDDFESNNYLIGMFAIPLGLMMTFAGIFIGFGPEIAKLKTKTTKYIQQENKQDLTDIATTQADIASEAVTKTASAIKKGLEDTKFCKYCGAKIDSNSIFCNQCGKEQ